jgi:hypothetical protein
VAATVLGLILLELALAGCGSGGTGRSNERQRQGSEEEDKGTIATADRVAFYQVATVSGSLRRSAA